MAFTLKIEVNKDSDSAKFDFNKLIERCGLEYGSDNDFFVLLPKKMIDNTVIVYNPQRVGRGIYLDMSESEQGILTLRHNIPTSPAEIRDFVRIVRECVAQLQDVSLYCEEEKRYFTVDSLEVNVDNMIRFCLNTLHETFLKDQRNGALSLVFMAKRPWILTNEQRERFLRCDSLDDFENTLHELQKDYIYTASPFLSKDSDTEKITALYVLLDEAGGFFPINPQLQLYMGGYQADEILVRFIANKKRLGVCSYAKFMAYMLRHVVKRFDANTVDIPEMSEETMMRILREIE